MKRRTLLKLGAPAVVLPAVGLPAIGLPGRPLHAQGKAAAHQDTGSLARQAYVYAYPMVKNYLTLYQYALETGGSQYKGPLNTLNSVARVYTPADTGIITPNSDTPYSFLVMDLRAEPLVVTLPPIEAQRYYSMQLVDLYTQNVDYLGTRRDGNGGGDFLLAGPSWQGEAPKGIKRVVRMTTDLGLGLIRTQLFDPADIANVERIQAGYKVRPLSAYAGTPPPAAPPAVNWLPISDERMANDFWPLAAFLMPFAPPQPWEGDLRRSFEAIGLSTGSAWPPRDMRPETVVALKAAADAEFKSLSEDALKLTTSAGLFGTPVEMKGKFRERALGALAGIYGNSVEEALYPSFMTDQTGQLLDASKHRYAFRFTRATLPPVGAFWSITMYDGVSRFLVDNPIDRYLINSPMLPDLKENANGEIVIYMQHDSPGEDLKANWLPAPKGRMGVVMRLYLPKPEALDGRWQPPVIEILS